MGEILRLVCIISPTRKEYRMLIVLVIPYGIINNIRTNATVNCTSLVHIL